MERCTTITVTPYFAEGEKYPGLIGVKAEDDEYETAYVCKTELIAAIEERDALKAYIDRKEHIHGVFEKDRRIAELEKAVIALYVCATDGDCGDCPLNDAHPVKGFRLLCDGIGQLLDGLGIEVD